MVNENVTWILIFASGNRLRRLDFSEVLCKDHDKRVDSLPCVQLPSLSLFPVETPSFSPFDLVFA
eukprot:Gb_10105 [translate_table: standard]